jgi:hypothetical protein
MPRVGPGFRIAAAYDFAEQHGLSAEAARIRDLPIHPSIPKSSAVKKGNFIRLFEQAGVMPEFVDQHWPTRSSAAGQKRYQHLLRRAELNRLRLEGLATAGNGVDGDGDDSPEAGGDDFGEAALFAIEAHLRDFIAGNMARVPIGGKRLSLYKGSDGKSGVEFRTGVGPIDILAVDESGHYYVFELKLARGPDRALGQLARYMGWVRVHLAAGKTVTGVIVANQIDEKLRYAAAVVPGIELLEYELGFSIRGVTPMTAAAP